MLELDRIYNMDCLEGIKEIEADIIDLVITDPPYWGLRDYGEQVKSIFGGTPDCEHKWTYEVKKWHSDRGKGPKKEVYPDEYCHKGTEHSFCSKCGAWQGQLGLEPRPQMYIDHLVSIFHEVRRVLKKTGSFYLNLGDTYWGSGSPGNQWNMYEDKASRGYCVNYGRSKKKSNWLQPKQLMLIPSRVAIALQEDGWILRNDIIWHKSNPMPSPVKDRLNTTFEHVFHFVKSRKYYYDLDAIRIPYKFNRWGGRYKKNEETVKIKPGDRRAGGQGSLNRMNYDCYPHSGKNPGDVMALPTKPFKGSHFAVFPEQLIEKPLKASCPPNGIVLDPFCGRGTAGKVAKKIGARYILFDIKPEYCELARRYITST